MTKTSRQKFKYFENKELLRWKKASFIILKGSLWQTIISDQRARLWCIVSITWFQLFISEMNQVKLSGRGKYTKFYDKYSIISIGIYIKFSCNFWCDFALYLIWDLWHKVFQFFLKNIVVLKKALIIQF